MRLSALLRNSGLEPLVPVRADPEIRGACLDSRRIASGDLFCAIPGFREDGASYAAEAVERGAAAVLARTPRPAGIPDGVAWVQVEEPRVAAGLIARECLGRPDESLALVGVTGTNGKTTVVHLIESIGKAAGRRTGRIGTLGAAFEGEERPIAHTTPEAPDLYRVLAEVRDSGGEIVAMEVSSHALALHRVEGARFAVAAFLNLGRDHLDFHQDEQAYFQAKARLFDALGPEGRAVLPVPSPWGDELRRRVRCPVLTFGRTADADVRLSEVRSGLEGASATLDTPAGRWPLRTFLLGRYNLDNVAAAAACALALGLPPEAIPAGVLALEQVPGRTEKVELGQPFTVLVDFAHTEQALDNLLEWSGEVREGRLLLVFGCGGSRDRGKRPGMGRVAAKHADRIFLTSDNPRDEDPDRILSEVAGGISEAADGLERSRLIVDRAEAIRAAVSEAEPGDLLVIAGKGHETTQTIGGRTLPFDDRQIARAALADRGWGGGEYADA